MKRILITGATGNIGTEVINYIYGLGTQNEIIAGVRNIDKAKAIFKRYDRLNFTNFDFEISDTFNNALDNIDMVFLLRPPHISDIDKYFKPFFQTMKLKGTNQIVFLSVQGAEKSKVIPHNKIERLILKHSFEYVILRPSYFMQNLTTTLYGDIHEKRKIILPASNAKFNWVDINNIAEAASVIIDDFEEYQNKSYDITGYENKSFFEVSEIINSIIYDSIVFENVNPIKFFKTKKKEGMAIGMILVMIMLHVLPRFKSEPVISDFYEKITGKKPTSVYDFVKREQEKFGQEI